MRVSTLPVFLQLWNELELTKKIKVEKQDLNFYVGNSLLHFGSLGPGESGVEKIKSTDWNIVWLEEANEFTYEDYRVLKLRLSAPTPDRRNQLFMSLNPISSYHWIKTELCDKPDLEDVQEIVSNYRDNPFLPQDYIQDLERLQLQNENYWKIYGLGEWGVLQEIVYEKPWIQVDALPESDNLYFGIDFGFNAPTSVVKIAIKDEEPYIQQLLYQTKLTNSDLIERLKTLIPDKERDKEIYCDSAEPDRIQELCNAGFNAMPSDKSVKDGIDYIKGLNVHVTKDSVDVIKEKNSYSYKKNRKSVV